MAFGALTPPLQGPDENRHLNRAVMIARGDFWATERRGIRGNEIPWSVLLMQQRLGTDVPFHPDVRQDPQRWRAELDVPLAPARTVFASLPSVHSPVPYVPQALAVAALAWLEPPPVVLLYAARIANLAVWTALVALALRIAPSHRWSLALIALTPMSVFVAATASADVTTNALALLWIAWVLRLRTDRRPIGRAAAAGLLALAVALSLCKLAYAALIALALLLPAQVFGSKRRRTIGLVALALACAVPVLGMFWLATGITHLDPDSTDTAAQLARLRAAPLDFARIVADSVRVDGLKWLRELVGVLGWLDTPLPAFVYPLWGALWIGVTACEAPSRPPAARWERALLGAIPLGVTLAILFTGFVKWTAPGEDAVRSFQGRYWIPVAPLVAIALQRRGAAGLPAWSAPGLVAACAMVLATAAVSLALRYHAGV